jgi:hypothetical protein
MAVNVNKIVVGGKTFTEPPRKSPQASMKGTEETVKEPTVEEDVSYTTASFILQSSSKFHRDMKE